MKTIEDLLKINSDYTTEDVARIWKSFDELTIHKINKMDLPLASIFHDGTTVMVQIWELNDVKKEVLVRIENCHISDDQLAYYHGGTALFLNLIRPDVSLMNNFYYGLCFNEDYDEDDAEDEPYYYDEDEYLENVESELVCNIATEILIEELME